MYCMPILQEQVSAMYRDVLYARGATQITSNQPNRKLRHFCRAGFPSTIGRMLSAKAHGLLLVLLLMISEASLAATPGFIVRNS